ncbi:erythromycin esterase family protein [Streptomyces sp. ISL-100]|uniref:erythromycin esterase family protein n=1 Tax=Streptomyces sp. ISL-100 TaxID=2819173 RepID=UPI001BEAE668|nr:erythromycin esterase family protein [Streptomyces sp. ISL-100]MBT2400154.1 erythromycin esterase family protein [Streptomyces sp. ISL-100]
MKRHRSALFLVLLLCAVALVTAAFSPPEQRALPAMEGAARPLRTTEPHGDLNDLRPFGQMVGNAQVVGMGEATHSSHEFFTMKHRVLRYLVEHMGFRAFALETSWSSGLRIDEYLLTGEGDPRQIMREEFQDTYAWWNTEEYLALVQWMRAYNVRHPRDRLRFVGDDFAYAGPDLYDKVLAYVGKAHPALLPRFTELYRGLRPTTTAGKYMKEYLTRPLAERRSMATRTERAMVLLKRHPVSAQARKGTYAWAVQNATAIAQTARGYAFDFEDQEQVKESMRFRDQLMADNIAWWHAHTGQKILLSAHNAHVSYRPSDPRYPKMQGAFLRDRFGNDYVSVGSTFGRGSFNATGPNEETGVYTLGPAARGSTEHLLDQVNPRDFAMDLRTVAKAARAWLVTARPTRSIGTSYPEPVQRIAPARSHDILIHLHRVRPARLLAVP